MAASFDVAVIGAGLSGIVAARDLSQKGYTVVLLEARDRVGGRTYTGKAFGQEMELGGAYVHWTQPHVWHEMQRHGISVTAPLESEKVYWLADGTVHSGTEVDYDAIITPIMDRLVADSRERFPFPFQPDAVDNSALDKETLADRITSLNLSSYERDVVEGLLSGMAPSYSQHGIAQLLLWVAANFGNYKAFFETGSVWAIEGGTKRLINAIMAESSAELRLSTPIAAISDNGAGVTITSRAGQKIISRFVVVAVPLNTLGDIAISPDVPAPVRTMIDQKNPVMGGKIWVRVRGEIAPFSSYAPAGKHPINVIRAEKRYNGDTILLCMCSDADAIDPKDHEAVQMAIRKFVPDIELIDTANHDWIGDEFSKGAWMVHRAGHLTAGALQMGKPHGRLQFVGSDIAMPGVSSIDGGMGNGAAAARDIAAALDPRTGL